MSEKQFLNYFDGTIKINQKLTIHTNKLKFKELRKMTKKLIHSSYLQYNLTEDEAITCNSRKMKNHCYCAAAQGIRNFVRWQSREIHKNTRSTAQFGRNLTEYMSVQHIWNLSGDDKLAIYLETLSLKRENVPVPGVLRLLLRKTGHWPVHDMKIFAIGTCTFLSSLLLEEQMMISDLKKKNCGREYQVQTRSQNKRWFWTQNRQV